MLGEQAQRLLRDVFAVVVPELDQAHPITRRIVRWGHDAPQVIPHRACVIAGNQLEPALPNAGVSRPDGEPAFTLSTAPPPAATLLRFGQREASARPVTLTPGADRHAALVEAIDTGWLFLIPAGGDSGWLLAVGAEADADDALADSRLVASAIAQTGAVTQRFETAPRILCDADAPGRFAQDHLTIGSAAIALDPICGDGVATAVRGGILAAAVAARIAGCGPDGVGPEGAESLAPDDLIAHYRVMLIAAMRRHLAASAPFYERGGHGAWWRAQAAAIAQGHAWCTQQLALAGEAQFMLAGDRLITRERVA